VVTAMGIVRFNKIKHFAKSLTVYGIIPVFIFFWIVPIEVNPKKFSVIPTALMLSKDEKIDYTNPLVFLSINRNKKVISDKLQFVEWTQHSPKLEYKLVYYFYLSDYFVHWNNERFQDWIKEGSKSIILFTNQKTKNELPRDSVNWIEIDSDKYNSLLVGMRK
jgi:hypothetical protein